MARIRVVRFLIIMAWSGLIVFPSSVCATSVLARDINQLARDSSMVVEGKVVSVNMSVDPYTRLPVTQVTVRVLDVVKGKSPGLFLDLSYLGGQVGGRMMKVDGSRVPVRGERGIYFVESPKARLVHPLAGWSQGHYLIRADLYGVHRVMTADGQPVLEMAEKMPVSTPGALSTGAAQGLVIGGDGQMTGGMTLSDFKNRLRESLGGP